jgi:hypothetical protein
MTGPDSDNPHRELFEKYGEARIRELVEQRRLGEPRATYARAWLQHLDDEREANGAHEGDHHHADHLNIARNAKEAAWAAADAARAAAQETLKANVVARVALVTAAIAVVVSVVALFR